MKKAIYLGSVALVAMMAPPLAAQTANNQATARNAEASDSRSTNALEEIVVIAQKRSENLQIVPLSVTALSGDQAGKEGKSNITEVLRDTAGVLIRGTGGTGAGVFIRGIGENANGVGTEPPVAMSVNGVVQSRNQSFRSGFYDVNRVEVVRGPDATLNGRNAEGGSVSVITNEPIHDYEASGTIEVGNYNLYAGNAAFNIPIGEKVAFRAAFMAEKRDGYLNNGSNDSDVKAGRVRLLLEPNDAIKVVTTADYSHTGGRGGLQSYTTPFDPTLGVIKPILGLYYNPIDATMNRDFRIINLNQEINFDMGFAHLFIQPSHQETTFYTNTASANYPAVTYAAFQAAPTTIIAPASYATESQFQKTHQNTIEARLSSPDSSPIKWIGGVYWLKNSEAIRIVPGNATVGAPPAYPAKPVLDDTAATPRRSTINRSVFGQITVPLNDGLRVIAGGRYTAETKKRNAGSTATYPTDNGIAGTTGGVGVTNVNYTVVAAEDTYKRFDYKLSVQADIGPKSMLYALTSTGFKGGGFNNIPANPTSIAPGYQFAYKPESLVSYEVGSKNQFLDNRLRLNVSAFYYFYKDLQITFNAPVFAASTGVDPDYSRSVTVNFDKARTYGSELESSFLLTSSDRINLNVSYLRAKLKRTSATALQPFEGRDAPRSPHWTLSPSYSHTFDFDGAGDVVASISGNYTAAQNTAIPPCQPPYTAAVCINPLGRLPSYFKANASLAYTSEDSRWTITAYVRNLTNKATIEGYIPPTNFRARVNGVPNAGTPIIQNLAFDVSDPRTYGMTLSVKF